MTYDVPEMAVLLRRRTIEGKAVTRRRPIEVITEPEKKKNEETFYKEQNFGKRIADIFSTLQSPKGFPFLSNGFSYCPNCAGEGIAFSVCQCDTIQSDFMAL